MTELSIVEDARALDELCAELAEAPWFALDTEFVREKTYYARLCLIQIATPERVACIDPLALTDLRALLELIYDPRIAKVMHAGYQDLEIFHQRCGMPPWPVFDTQIAAGLLGYGDQPGLARLVEALLGVALDKSLSRTDWQARPLAGEQIRYAADDVRYLVPVYRRLHAELLERGRLDWVVEDCERLCEPDTYRHSPAQLWRRVRGAQELKPPALAVLRALTAWREARAETENRPRRWVLPDAALVELARRAPCDRAELGAIRTLRRAQARRYGDALLEAIERGRSEPEAAWPSLDDGPRLTPAQESLVDELMAATRELATQRSISPSALATRAGLERFVRGDEDAPMLRGWRAQVAGERLKSMAAGDNEPRPGPTGTGLRDVIR